MFTKLDYSSRRSLLHGVLDTDICIVAANGLVQKSADTTFPFRQDSNFLYLSGLAIPEALLILNRRGDDYIILPKRLKHRDQWEGAIDTDALRITSGIDQIYSYEEGWKKLSQQVHEAKQVGVLLPARSYEPNYGMHINPAKVRFAKKIKQLAKNKLIDARSAFAYARSIKSSLEVDAIRRAITITQQSLQAVKSQLHTIHSERTIQTLLTYEFMQRGADGHAYDPIIASGNHATTIHYDKNDGELKNGELLLLDVGASFSGYAADISRTWFVGEAHPSARQQAVFAAVYDTQQYAMSLLKPGVLLREYETATRLYMNQRLVELGLMNKGDKSASTKYFPHLCSHFLGLDVHDAGVYDKPLEAGMVLTVEPGVYIPEESIGVRLEDNVLVTATGIENLSRGIESTLL